MRDGSAMAEICCEDRKASLARRKRRFRFDAGPAAVTRRRIPIRVVVAEEESKSSPIESPSTSAEAGRCPRHGVISVCGRRREMEDAISIRPGFAEGMHFFGVFDGHGCSHVAASCKDRMHEYVAEELGRDRRAGSEEEWRGAMERSFARMDASVGEAGAGTGGCRCETQAPKRDHVGSTAVVAVVTAERVVVSNCGDSRAVLCRRGGFVALSEDHKPDRPDEQRRIEAAGGRVIYWDGARVLGVLAMSRAIGDSYLKPYVVAEPEVTVTERGEEDECLILASDGLWDVVSNETACDVVRRCLNGAAMPGPRSMVSPPPPPESEAAPPGAAAVHCNKACADAALLLTKLALARNSADNVSVVVVDLRKIR
ncbi:putative protein phosphatase 2C 9 [Wolffia australiana]